jgi:hypothetical protein
MNKKILYFGILLFVFSCTNEKKTNEKVESKKESTWLKLENNDSIQFLGFSERRVSGNPVPFVFAHYKSERFNGDGNETEFKKETLLVAKMLKEKSNIPDSLVLQVMGESNKSGFINKQSNWNTPVIFDGEKWKFTNEK